MSPSKHLYIPVYVATLLISAFLLFLVQPMFGKMILPLLGGSPSVWNAAMLFFQVTLLAGYAYAHGTARFMGIRAQALLHITLLAIFAMVLPIAIPDGWTPPANGDPTFWQLSLMTIAVGGPFFILSASAPMLQHWFAHTKHPDAENPYFLYAASNLGSISALLVYPFFVEPALKISEQSISWAWGYGLLAIFVAISALLVWKQAAPEAVNEVKDSDKDEVITWERRTRWLILAFIPSSLMLGVTTFITTDLASAPLLWIVPLALYVGTFVIAFSNKPLINLKDTHYVQGLVIITVLSAMMALGSTNKPVLIAAHLALFFFTALLCHHELSAARPNTKHLTQFYLLMSLGGALGGFFNAIVAPHLFVVPLEYGVALVLGCFVRGINDPKQSFKTAWGKLKDKLEKKEKGLLNATGMTSVIVIALASAASLRLTEGSQSGTVLMLVFLGVLTINLDKRWIFGLCTLVILTFNPPGFFWGGTANSDVIHRDRNFFGIIRVIDYKKEGMRMLLHGTTAHGAQPLAKEYKHLQLSYYTRESSYNDAFNMADKSGPQKIATLGLGIGVVACFKKEGRSFDFFEIDPNVIKVAEDPKFFTYLSDCGSPYEIVLGDARLKLEDKPDGYYDMIVMDAFSSDSIPTHLLTAEAFKLYKRKLKKDGYLIVHISNRYLSLRPVVAKAAEAIDMNAYNRLSPTGEIEGFPYFATDLMVLTKQPAHISYLEEHDWEKIEPDDDFRLWTDQYSNIVSVLKIFQGFSK